MKSSFSEKSCRLQIVVLTAVLLLYIKTAYSNYADGFTGVVGNISLIIWSCVTLTALYIVGYIYTALTTKVEDLDERDLLVRYKAKANSMGVISSGCIFAAADLALAANPLWAPHILMVTLFLTSIVSEGLKLYYYKRGF